MPSNCEILLLFEFISTSIAGLVPTIFFIFCETDVKSAFLTESFTSFSLASCDNTSLPNVIFDVGRTISMLMPFSLAF